MLVDDASISPRLSERALGGVEIVSVERGGAHLTILLQWHLHIGRGSHASGRVARVLVAGVLCSTLRIWSHRKRQAHSDVYCVSSSRWPFSAIRGASSPQTHAPLRLESLLDYLKSEFVGLVQVAVPTHVMLASMFQCRAVEPLLRCPMHPCTGSRWRPWASLRRH